MSSSENDLKYTPLDDIRQVVTKSATINLLPSKSKQIYEAAYEKFVKWREERNFITSEDCLLCFFEQLEKTYKPTTLWSQYSMLKCIINLKENIDIGQFRGVTEFLKLKSRGFQSKKANLFSAESILKFLSEAPDKIYLVTKVVLIFGITGACKVDELVNIKVHDIEEHGELVLVKISDANNKKLRSFTIGTEYAKFVKQYLALRPENIACSRFFLNFQKGKCTNQVIGKNKIATMAKQIASFLRLENPESYTGHSLRRTAASLPANIAEANILDLQSHGKDWTSSKVPEEDYFEDESEEELMGDKTCKIEEVILNEMDFTVTNSDDESGNEWESPASKRAKYNEDEASTSKQRENPHEKIFYLKDCNVTINYNTS